MMPLVIRKEVMIKAPPERVWRYIGTEEGLRQWWGLDITLEEKQGGRCAERTLLHGKVLHLTGEVTIYDPPRQLVLHLRQGEDGAPWPAFTTISLTLKAEQDHTIVLLEHQGIGTTWEHQPTRWPARPSQLPAPKRQPILNQLPSRDFVVVQPAPPPPQNTWLHTYEARWSQGLDKLQQLATEQQGEESR